MSNAEGMRSLAQNITASYDARIGELASIRQQTSDMLSEFHRMDDERKTAVSNMKKEVSDLRSNLHKECEDREKEVSNMKKEASCMLDGFKKDREDAVGAWHDLAATMESKRGNKTRKTVKVRQAHHKGKKG